jgi:hypothetical protein
MVKLVRRKHRREKMKATISKLMAFKNRTIFMPYGESIDAVAGFISHKLDKPGMAHLVNSVDWNSPKPIEFLPGDRLILTLKPDIAGPDNRGECYVV